MKVTLKNNRIISLVLAVILAFSVVPAFADSSSQGATYLAFTSDVHNGEDSGAGNTAKELDKWISNVSVKLGGIKFDSMGFCGDYAMASLYQENSYWKCANEVYDVVSKNITNGKIGHAFYVTGNHETWPGNYTEHKNDPFVKVFQKNGSTYVDPNGAYIFYAFGATNNDYNHTGFIQSDIDALKAYLENDSTPKDVPIFILSHFPLHELKQSGSQTRITKNREKVISILNDASENHRIFFVWGHNHSQNDPRYDLVHEPGSIIDNQAYNFTYLSAGSGSDSEFNKYGGNVKGRGLVAIIDQDHNVSLKYYDKNYVAFADTFISFEPFVQEVSYLAEYQNGQMINFEPITNQRLVDAQDGKFTFTIPQSNADERKLFFVGDDWKPNQVFLIQ